MKQLDYEILIIGAGISGIGMAVHLKQHCPDRRFTILERREAIGGTWDLFRYPGIRSDSDMATFGFAFKPWLGSKTLADGASIRAYVQEAAQEHHILEKIQFGQRMLTADWSAANQCWTVTIRDERTQQTRTLTARYLIGCTGYYNYDQGYRPTFEGEAQFKGTILHPQHWPDGLNYQGKRVVIIGSGATAVTLVPAMSEQAAQVTMLQRSPTYVASLPAHDILYETVSRFIPAKPAYQLTRLRNIAMQRGIYMLSQHQPNLMRRILLSGVKRQLPDASLMTHFTPRYNPWEQRLCAVPNGDLFKAIRSGRANVVTDQIDHFVADGIALKSGQILPADIVVVATGLSIQMLGGATVSVEGQPYQANKHVTYKGVLMEDLPNAAIIFGYTNASWTLKVDIAAEYICRLFNYMQRKGYATFRPRAVPNQVMLGENMMGSLTSGYIQRADSELPRQGKTHPWQVTQNYLHDRKVLLNDPIPDPGRLDFDVPTKQKTERFRWLRSRLKAA